MKESLFSRLGRIAAATTIAFSAGGCASFDINANYRLNKEIRLHSEIAAYADFCQMPAGTEIKVDRLIETGTGVNTMYFAMLHNVNRYTAPTGCDQGYYLIDGSLPGVRISQ